MVAPSMGCGRRRTEARSAAIVSLLATLGCDAHDGRVDSCSEAGESVTLRLKIGIEATPASFARVTEPSCGTNTTANAAGLATIRLPPGRCAQLFVDHPSAMPAAIGMFSPRPSAREMPWEIALDETSVYWTNNGNPGRVMKRAK